MVSARAGLILLCVVLVGGGSVGAAPPTAVDTTQEGGGVADSLDTALAAQLRAIYQEVEAFQDIEVRVRHQVVHLSGTVLQPQQATEAADLARSREAVVYVSNEISAQADLADRVSPVLTRLENYGTALVDFLPVGLIALLVVLGTTAFARWIGRWEAPGRMRISPMAWGLVRRAVQFGVALVGLLITFDLLGVTSIVGALLGTAGVAGLAIGFAFRDIIENYLAGVLLSVRQPFRVNDVVSIADHEGRVVRLTAREVVLLTFDGNHVRLPNGTVFKSVIVNYTQNAQRLFFFDVGVGVNEDLAEAQRVGVETLDAMKGVLAEPPPFARVEGLGDSTVTIRLHGWVDQEAADYFKVKSEAIRLAKQAFDEADIEMPEPAYRVQTHEASEASPRAAKGPSSSVAEQAQQIDVAPDERLERKVEEELRTSDEPNLLSG